MSIRVQFTVGVSGRGPVLNVPLLLLHGAVRDRHDLLPLLPPIDLGILGADTSLDAQYRRSDDGGLSMRRNKVVRDVFNEETFALDETHE